MYDLVRTTLWRRLTSQTVARSEATPEFRQALNEAQKKVLLSHIGPLVTRRTSPTPLIVVNIKKRIYGGHLSKHWATRFIQRHLFYLKGLSIYAKYGKSMKKS